MHYKKNRLPEVDFNNDIEQCLLVLQQGGLILYPTDTIWGIGCDATNEAAVGKLYQLKQRPDEKTMIILVAEEKDILQYVTQPHPEIFDDIAEMGKPVTVIYEGAINLADNLVGNDGTVAIRIVEDEFCRHLIKRFRKPIVSTSANISGEPSPAVFSDITDTIKNGVDYIVQHRQDEMTASQASAIIKKNKDGSLTILRS